jgi:carboxypeptidase T
MEWARLTFGKGVLVTRILFSLILVFVGTANANVLANRKYKDVVAYLHQLAQQYPQNVKLFTLATSDDGVAIEGVVIGKGPAADLVVAAHHGNEYASTEVALNFAESVAKSPMPGRITYVIPVLNINGYDARIREEKVNGHLLDSNRDYPGPCGTGGPFELKSTKALAQFLQKQKIVAAATMHTFEPAVAFPWGVSTDDVETEYTSIFEKMAAAATKDSHYQYGYSGKVLYPVDGAFEDYAFWKFGVWSMLFEVGTSHSPTGNSLNEIVRTNVSGLRGMFAVAPNAPAAKHEFTGTCLPSQGQMISH